MKNALIHIALVFFSFNTLAQEEILTPLGSTTKDIYLLAGDSNSLTNGYFPTARKNVGYEYHEKEEDRNWIFRKLFREHLIEKRTNAYFIAVDPLLNISLGDERLQNNSEEYLFRNTRGAQAMGQIGDKFAFYTAFFENQARFVDYRNAYFMDRGEQRYNGLEYLTSNAVIPNGGRTKPFKTTGFDYASSMSYVRFKPVAQLNIHVGNNPSFIGWGHRSFLLSDNSFNFTHFKVDWNILPNLTYTLVRGKQLNLLRKRYTNLVEPPFERKGIGMHYLSYQPIKNVSIGVFESSVYLRDEATSVQSLSNYFYNPLIGLNTAVIGSENEAVRNFMGFNIGWRIAGNHLLYAQGVSGDLSSQQYGIQFGYRNSNLFTVKNLNIQLEYNKASDRLYAARNRRMAYTHFNLPLAHTLGNGFEEIIFRARYSRKGIYANIQHVYYTANQLMHLKTALFDAKSDYVQDTPVSVNYSMAELGYVLNEKTMLSIYGRGVYRQSSSDLEGNINHGMIFFGMRSNLFNNYMDF